MALQSVSTCKRTWENVIYIGILIPKKKQKNLYIELCVFRSSPSEVLSKKVVLQTWSKPTGEQPCVSAISTKLICNFTEITLCTDIPLKRHRTSAGLSPRKEHIWRNACVCHKSFKRLCFKKLLITVFKTNLLICNKNNNKNNKCPVIEPSTFRKVLRFFYWALLFWQ